jgi:hypothetical protein
MCPLHNPVNQYSRHYLQDSKIHSSRLQPNSKLKRHQNNKLHHNRQLSLARR